MTLGLAVPEDEQRMVATVSLSYMQKILSFDRDALLLTVEAGAVGVVLEEQLRRLGVTLGHEPDSLEFSTVGGWVATRASGGASHAFIWACIVVLMPIGSGESSFVDFFVSGTRGKARTIRLLFALVFEPLTAH